MKTRVFVLVKCTHSGFPSFSVFIRGCVISSVQLYPRCHFVHPPKRRQEERLRHQPLCAPGRLHHAGLPSCRLLANTHLSFISKILLFKTAVKQIAKHITFSDWPLTSGLRSVLLCTAEGPPLAWTHHSLAARNIEVASTFCLWSTNIYHEHSRVGL